MKSLQEHPTDALQPVFESTNIGQIPTFKDFEDIKNYFLSVSGMTDEQVDKRHRNGLCYCVELYGGEWNGRHIYVTYYGGYNYAGEHDSSNIGIWYSDANKKPKFDIWLMRKTSNIRHHGAIPGGSGVDGVQFNLTDPSDDFYGNKKAIDDLFGKPMPWMRGSEKVVCDTINAIIQGFNVVSWQMIRKK